MQEAQVAEVRELRAAAGVLVDALDDDVPYDALRSIDALYMRVTSNRHERLVTVQLTSL